MSPTLILCAYSYLLLLFNACESLNTWNSSIGVNGEDIWISTSDFVPQQSQSFGTIRLGQIMSVAFDFVWGGRTSDPRVGYDENFFRIGYSANEGKTCSGQNSNYPSFWLNRGDDTLFIDITNGTLCTPPPISLSSYGTIIIGVKYHIEISFNNTEIYVAINNSNKNWNQTWTKQATESQFLGSIVSVWLMSDKYSGTDYNRGNATMSNIIIKSSIFPTTAPTSDPTIEPTTAIPTADPSMNPTYNPSVIPTENPSNVPTNNPTNNPTYMPSITPTIPP
eukprot:370313_1